MLLNTGDKVVESKHGLLTTVLRADRRGKEYALEGSVFIGGAVVQWLRDGLGFIQLRRSRSARRERARQRRRLSRARVHRPRRAATGTRNARGAIIGITRGNHAPHRPRGARIDRLPDRRSARGDAEGLPGSSLIELRVDGGAAANDMLMQIQADLLGVPVVRPKVIETTALGAAYLAGLAVDLWKSRDELATHWKVDKRFEPQAWMRLRTPARSGGRATGAQAVGRSRQLGPRLRGGD